ncbi:hypothetical protein [Kitasatospora sp. NPDC056184]|uniref:hypothetical protein n=1 Tax=Kitasatospora sp. NPDC056184 TaxID=3345738 RepID=UPI0035D62ADA
MYEVEHGQPMLSALVVIESSRVPGPGFTKLARHLNLRVENDETFWQEELDRTLRFWSAQDPLLVLDAAIDRLMGEFRAIKNAVRKLQ